MIKIYDTLDELYLHTMDDDLAMFLKCADLDDDYYYDSIYAVCLGILAGVLTISDYGRIKVYLTGIFAYEAEDLFKGAATADKEETEMFCSTLMHIMHKKDPDLRRRGTIELCEFLMEDKGHCRLIYIGYEGYHLTGKDSVPEEFRKVIYEVASKYGCAARVSVDFSYSHLYCGIDYAYDKDEDLMITLCGESIEALDLAEKELKGLKLGRKIA